jgi:N-acetylglutamate synthase-like GNAT family acetyltransferase
MGDARRTACSTRSAACIAKSLTLLDAIESYYDAVPRTAARVEHIGPFTVFVKQGAGWPYYARPTLGASHFSADEVRQVRARQRELGIPQALEWVAQTTPGLMRPAQLGGLHVTAHPLMVLGNPAASSIAPGDGLDVRLVTVADDLALMGAVAPVAFSTPGTEVGQASFDAVRTMAIGADADAVEFRRERLRTSRSVMAIALHDGNPIGVGSHQPIGAVTEITGVGVVPAFRRRGIAAALTATLVEDALARGIQTIFLSAGDDAVARVYERVGFRTIATACIAEPATADH